MFFFIAGVQPRRRMLDRTPRRCPQCGLHQAYLQQIDHYASLFFIPLFPVKRGKPFLFCNRCQQAVSERPQEKPVLPAEGTPSVCSRCGKDLSPEFSFCPFCGQRR